MSEPDATITAPVTQNPNNTEIYIGMNRATTSGNTGTDGFHDCDYNYSNENWVSGLPVPPLWIPFAGTFNPHTVLATGGQFTSGLTLTTQIFDVAGKQHWVGNPPDPTKVTGDSNNIVHWDYTYNSAQGPANVTSLVYPSLPNRGPVTVAVAFFFHFNIPLQGDNSVDFWVCSTDWPDTPTPNCKQIPGLRFWWHCLAEGTLVTLADGSTRAIEHVDNKCRVRTGHGSGSLGVEATTRGVHHKVEPNHPVSGIYRLTTEDGHSLVLTGGHPVATEDGLVRASDLEPGSTIHTQDGVSRVAGLEAIDSEAIFCNLKLIDAADRAKGLGSTVGTFFANGILVGDHRSMEQVHYDNTHSLDYMKARLPERYHADYASTLAAIARDNLKYGARY